MDNEAIRRGAKEIVSALVEDAGDRAGRVAALGRQIEIAFELAVIGGDPEAFAALERRLDMLAEIARVHTSQTERAAYRQGALLAARVLRAALLAA